MSSRSDCTVWELRDEDVEFVEGISTFSFNETLKPFESVNKKSYEKYSVVPILDWEFKYGEFTKSDKCKQVSVSLSFERDQETDKSYMLFSHDSWLLGKWNCTQWSPQLQQAIDCASVKVQEARNWEELVRANENTNANVNGGETAAVISNKRKKKKRRIAIRDKNTYRFKDVKLHPLIMFVDENNNWMIKLELSLLCYLDNANNFGKETNKLLSDLFLSRDVERYVKKIDKAKIRNEFSDVVSKYTEQTVRKGVQIEVPPQLDVSLMPFQMESIDWMLRKEGYYDKEDTPPARDVQTTEELLEFLNEHISFGYQYMPIGGVFWNKFTGYILPVESAFEIYREWISNHRHEGKRAKGLLAEEMGLGKTIEILCLFAKNVRTIPKGSENETFISPLNGKIIKRVKTNLVVCPESILQQWIDEMAIHIRGEDSDFSVFHYEGFEKARKRFNNEQPKQIVERLAEYNVIICSYSTLSSEVHYAEFSQIQRPSRESTRRYDYTSPLSVMEFHRIILDEAQLLRRTLYATRCADTIHRVHTWGVSGTPVQWFTEVQNIFGYLQIHPFHVMQNIVSTVSSIEFRRKRLLLRPDAYNAIFPEEEFNGFQGSKVSLEEFVDIFPRFNLAIRHLKRDVQNQIKIPRQINYMVPVEFNPIEQDHYVNLWNSFLSVSGYDSRGNGSGNLDTSQLSVWLNRLRMTCCHASMSIMNGSEGVSWRETDELKDMDAILDGMREEVLDKIYGLQRENYAIKIQLGQVRMEIDEKFEDAISIFKGIIKEITHDLKQTYGIENFLKINEDSVKKGLSTKNMANIRLLLHILHQAFFFLATTCYQLGTKKLDEAQADAEADAETEVKSEVKSETKSIVYTADEMSTITRFQELEKYNYGIAEQLRREMLHERIYDVDSEINRVRDWLMNAKHKRKMLLDTISSKKGNLGSILESSYIFQKMVTLFGIMNQQAQQFNRLMKDLEVLSYNTIIKDYDNDDNDEEKAKEYGRSIDDQDKVFSILDVMERILKNREDMMVMETTVEPVNVKLEVSLLSSEFHAELLKSTVFVHGETLKQLLNKAEEDKSIRQLLSKSGLANHGMQDFINCYEMEIPRIVRENQEVRNGVLKRFNDIYNAKTSYYSYLQRISDSLVPLSDQSVKVKNGIIKRVNEGYEYESNVKVIHNLESRVRYLETLSQLKSAIARGENISCAICYSEIYTGSILKCGHFFCKECVTHWFRKNASCPLCKNAILTTEVYHFKFREGTEDAKEETKEATAKAGDAETEVKANCKGQEQEQEGREGEREGSEEDIITKKYSRFSKMSEVDNVVLGNSWGGKVDQVLKLIMYIKQKHLEDEPHKKRPQIVVYSSHQAFLDILSRLLMSHGIVYARSVRNTKFAKAVNKFRKDPECTCLLLNLQSQATGLTLVNARHLILLDPILGESTEQQAISRIHRIGQSEETYVWNFMVRNTVEESIMKYKAILAGAAGNTSGETSGEDNFSLEDLSSDSRGKEHLWHCLFESGSGGGDTHHLVNN